MKAIVANTIVEGDNYSSVLREIEVEKPVPAGRDILIAVKAVATNPVDTKALAGKIATPPSENHNLIAGWDGSGVVDALGEGVTHFKVGDEVFFAGSLIRAGSFAEYVLVDERIVALKPKNLSFAEAASLPLTTITAWESFVKLLQIPIPKTEEEKEANGKKVVLIVGGAGGVGTIATQIAKRVLNLTVISTASREDSIHWVKKHGADFTINHNDHLLPQIEKLGWKGVHYILCCADISARYFNEFVESSLPFGKIAFITANHENVNLGALMWKSLTIAGELMFTRPILGDDIEYQHELLSHASDLVEKNILTATNNYEYSFSLENIIQSLILQRSGKAVGKIVLSRQ